MAEVLPTNRELKLICSVAVSALIGLACSASPPGRSTPKAQTPAALTSDTVAPTNAGKTQTEGLNGRQLYAENCMVCHRKTATGGATTIQGKKIKPADLTKERLRTWSDDRWLGDVQAGDPDEGMPAFKDKLSPEQIMAIVNYIRTL